LIANKLSPSEPSHESHAAGYRPYSFRRIGGIGMSGIAEVLHHSGYKVQGTRRRRERQHAPLQETGTSSDRTPCREYRQREGRRRLHRGQSATTRSADGAGAAGAAVRRAEMLGELMRLKWAIAVGALTGKTPRRR